MGGVLRGGRESRAGSRRIPRKRPGAMAPPALFSPDRCCLLAASCWRPRRRILQVVGHPPRPHGFLPGGWHRSTFFLPWLIFSVRRPARFHNPGTGGATWLGVELNLFIATLRRGGLGIGRGVQTAIRRRPSRQERRQPRETA